MRASLPPVRTGGLARGGCAPLRTPGLSRRCRSAWRTGGAAPGPPQRCAPGAAAHRCGRRPPHAGRPARRRRGPPALQRRERANEAVSGLGERLDAALRIEEPAAVGDVTRRRLHPPKAGCSPSRRDKSRRRARAGSDPERGKRGGNSRPFPGSPSRSGTGVAPSPGLRANAENGIEDAGPEGQRGQAFSRTPVHAENGKRSGKRGVLSFCRETLTPKAAQQANEAVPAASCELVFPGRSGEWELRTMAPTNARWAAGVGERATVRGFRSTFSDWSTEEGSAPMLAEAALVDVVQGVEGA